MCMILLRPPDVLAVERVLHPPLDLHHHGLVGLVGHDGPGQNALRHGNSLTLLSGAVALALQGLDLRDAAAHFADPRRLIDLVRGALEAPVELLALRSEEHTSELQSLMRTSYAVFCLKKKTQIHETRLTK